MWVCACSGHVCATCLGRARCHYVHTAVCVRRYRGRGGGWNAGKWGCGGRAPSCSCAVSAPADQDASQLYYSYRITSVGRGVLGWGGGGGGRGGGLGKGRGGGGDPSRHYAVSAPADQDASQLYYSFRIIRGGGGGVRESLVVVTQCLLQLTRTHHSYTTHSVSLVGGGGGGGAGERERWEGDPSRSYAVSAPADQDASQQYYSFSITGGRGWGKGEVGGRA